MNRLRSVGLIVLLMALFLAIWQFLSPERPPAPSVPYSEFVTLVAADKTESPHVFAATIDGRRVTFWVADPKSGTKSKKATVAPEDTKELVERLIASGATVWYEQPEGAGPMGLLGAVAAALVVLLVVFSVRNGRLRSQVKALEALVREQQAEIGRVKAPE